MNALVYPHCTKVAKLEYEWDGYSTVILFATDHEVASVQEWYRKCDLSFKVVDPDQYDLFSDDTHRKKVAEVCFASDSYSYEDLSSYLASEALDAMVETKPQTIGVVFIVNRE